MLVSALLLIAQCVFGWSRSSNTFAVAVGALVFSAFITLARTAIRCAWIPSPSGDRWRRLQRALRVPRLLDHGVDARVVRRPRPDLLSKTAEPYLTSITRFAVRPAAPGFEGELDPVVMLGQGREIDFQRG